MKKLIALLGLILLLSCEREDCQVCTTFAPETLIISTQVICGERQIQKVDGRIDTVLISGQRVIAKTTCRKF